jgi:hypothetical protein
MNYSIFKIQAAILFFLYFNTSSKYIIQLILSVKKSQSVKIDSLLVSKLSRCKIVMVSAPWF